MAKLLVGSMQPWETAPMNERVNAWMQFYRQAEIASDTSRQSTLWRSQVVDKMLEEAKRLDPLMSQAQKDELQFYLIGQINRSVTEITENVADLNAVAERLQKSSLSQEQFTAFRGELGRAMGKLKADIAQVKGGSTETPEQRELKARVDELAAAVNGHLGQVAGSFEAANGAVARGGERLGQNPEAKPVAERTAVANEVTRALVENVGRVETLSQAGLGLAAILAPFEPELAGKLAVVSESSFKMAKAAAALGVALQNKEAIAAMVASGGMVSAGVALLSAFGAGGLGGGGPDPATMKALQQISRQLEELETVVRVNFDRVHATLAEIGVDVDTLRFELNDLRQEIRWQYRAIERGESLTWASTQRVLERLTLVQDSLRELEEESATQAYRRTRTLVLRASEDQRTGFDEATLTQQPYGHVPVVETFLRSDLLALKSPAREFALYRDPAERVFAGSLTDLESWSLGTDRELPASGYASSAVERALPWIAAGLEPRSIDERWLPPALIGLNAERLAFPTLWKDGAATLLHLFLHNPDKLGALRRQGRVDLARQGLQFLELARMLTVAPQPYQKLEARYEGARVALLTELERGHGEELARLKLEQGEATRASLERQLIGSVPNPRELSEEFASDFNAGRLRYYATSQDPALRERWFGPVTAHAADAALVSRAAQLGLVQLAGKYRISVDGDCLLQPTPPGRRPRDPEVPPPDGECVWTSTHYPVSLEFTLNGFGDAAAASGALGRAYFALRPPRITTLTPSDVLARALGSLGDAPWPAQATVSVSHGGVTTVMQLTTWDGGTRVGAGANQLTLTLSAAQRSVLEQAIREADKKLNTVGQVTARVWDQIGDPDQLLTETDANPIRVRPAYAVRARQAERNLTLAVRELASVLAYAFPRLNADDPGGLLSKVLDRETGVVENGWLRSDFLEKREQGSVPQDLHAFARVWTSLAPVQRAVAERHAVLAELERVADQAGLERSIARLARGDARDELEATLIRRRVELLRAAGIQMDEELASYVELLAAFVGGASISSDPVLIQKLCATGQTDLGGSCGRPWPSLPANDSVSLIAALPASDGRVSRVWSYPKQSTQVTRHAWFIPGAADPSALLVGLTAGPFVSAPNAGTRSVRVLAREVANPSSAARLQTARLSWAFQGEPARPALLNVEALVSAPDGLELRFRFEDPAAATTRVPMEAAARVTALACADVRAASFCNGRTGNAVFMETWSRWSANGAVPANWQRDGEALWEALVGDVLGANGAGSAPRVPTLPSLPPEELTPIDLEPLPRPLPRPTPLPRPLPRPLPTPIEWDPDPCVIHPSLCSGPVIHPVEDPWTDPLPSPRPRPLPRPVWDTLP
jgi:hypothetical protein